MVGWGEKFPQSAAPTDTFIIVVPFSQIINFILSTWACVWKASTVLLLFFFACSCHSSFCAFSLPLSANLFMPAFGLKIYHFSFSMFVPNSFRAQNTFCFSFRAVVLRRWVFYVLSDRAQTRGNSRDSQSAFQSQPKTWATWSSGEGPGVVKRLQTTMARSECFVFCHIKKT